MIDRSAARKTAVLIALSAGSEGVTILVFSNAFLPPVLHPARAIPIAAWFLAAVVSAAYIMYAMRGLPIIGKLMLNFAAFKLLGPLLAVPSAILEEVFFRQFLMDAFIHSSPAVQILLSAFTFGLAHAVWAIRGGRQAFAGAVGSTGILGAALAIVYLAAGRIVLPCIAAHFIINVVLEPWLMYAYVMRTRGAGGRGKA